MLWVGKWQFQNSKPITLQAAVTGRCNVIGGIVGQVIPMQILISMFLLFFVFCSCSGKAQSEKSLILEAWRDSSHRCWRESLLKLTVRFYCFNQPLNSNIIKFDWAIIWASTSLNGRDLMTYNWCLPLKLIENKASLFDPDLSTDAFLYLTNG